MPWRAPPALEAGGARERVGGQSLWPVCQPLDSVSKSHTNRVLTKVHVRVASGESPFNVVFSLPHSLKALTAQSREYAPPAPTSPSHQASGRSA